MEPVETGDSSDDIPSQAVSGSGLSAEAAADHWLGGPGGPQGGEGGRDGLGEGGEQHGASPGQTQGGAGGPVVLQGKYVVCGVELSDSRTVWSVVFSFLPEYQKLRINHS